MKRLKIKTISRLASLRGWVTYDMGNHVVLWPSSDSNIYHCTCGYMTLGKDGHIGNIAWKDARMKDGGNVHINTYHGWPSTIDNCNKMMDQIDGLIKKYL